MTKRELKRWKKRQEEKDEILSQCSSHFVDKEGVTAVMIHYLPEDLVIGPLMDYREYNLFQLGNKTYELRSLDEKDGAVVKEIHGEITHMSTRDFIKWVVIDSLKAKEDGQTVSLADMEAV